MLVRRDLLVAAAGRDDAERLPRRVHPGGARVVPDVDLAEVALAAGVVEIVDDGGVGGGCEGEKEEEGGGVHGWGVVVLWGSTWLVAGGGREEVLGRGARKGCGLSADDAFRDLGQMPPVSGKNTIELRAMHRNVAG